MQDKLSEGPNNYSKVEEVVSATLMLTRQSQEMAVLLWCLPTSVTEESAKLYLEVKIIFFPYHLEVC